MAEENTDDFNEEKEVIEAEAAAKLEADEKEEDDKKGDAEKTEEETEEKEEKYDEKEEPPTRKSVQDHIIERKNKKIEKLEKKEKEEEDNFTPEDKDAIGKEIDKKTEPLKEVLKAQSDKNELDSLKIKYPDLSKVMEKRIAKYANHKSYQDVPYENIYLMLAGQKSISQAKKAEAKKGDKKNETGGHTKRAKKGGEPDYAGMSDKEFDKVDQDLMTGQL
jgi:hypothetical protein